MAEPSDEAERAIREACDARRFDAAVNAALNTYGREILSFLAALLRSESDAHEVYSLFSEDLWKGIAKFGWRSSMRTWSYTLARNAAARYMNAPYRRSNRNVPFRLPASSMT